MATVVAAMSVSDGGVGAGVTAAAVLVGGNSISTVLPFLPGTSEYSVVTNRAMCVRRRRTSTDRANSCVITAGIVLAIAILPHKNKSCVLCLTLDDNLARRNIGGILPD